MVERNNRTLENQLATFVQDHQKDWDLHLPLLLLSYRSAVDETTKLTPAVLMFGRELRVPLDLLFGRPQADIEDQSYLEYAERLRLAIATFHDFARDQQQAGSQGMKTRYDIRSEAFTFSKGRIVWLYNPQREKGKSPKLSRPWEGPYAVVERSCRGVSEKCWTEAVLFNAVKTCASDTPGPCSLLLRMRAFIARLCVCSFSFLIAAVFTN